MATAESAQPQNALVPSSGGEGSAYSSNFMKGFNRLNLARQAGLMIALAASIALGFSVVLWSQKESYQPLYPSMQGFDTSELVQVMDTAGISYRIDPASGVLLVPSNSVDSVRLQVASAGVTRDNGYGYEFLDQEQSLGTSQFMEENRYKRSMEGELQRTITSFRYVQSARVHLATPERSVFVRNSRKPTASVFLALHSGRQLSDTQVQAIANLVASSVPEMMPEDVTVVDQQGNLLSRTGENEEMMMASEQFAYVRRYEETLVGRVNRILHPLLGAGKFTAEVAADVDFTRTEQAAETYNPEGSSVRSEQSLNERRATGDVIAGIPGALSNQPPGAANAPETLEGVDGGAPAAEPTNIRNQETRNYELDRTISYTNYDPVSVRRLSVAVVIDEPVGEAAQGWSAEDMERISALVRDAVGYNAERGDSVTVINKAFAQVEELAGDALPFWQASWFAPALRQAAAALFVLILVFGVLMPSLKRLTVAGSSGRSASGSGEASSEVGYADIKAEHKMKEDSVTLSGGDDILLAGPAESYERQLEAIKGLVAEDPARAAQVVKNWISNDG
ncbi:flagellar basal-body MS-ring/collar protein FliF [Pseudohongiella sp.]|uniref:Flagellar M-ring protein n=1 Tax=marine sediment metagenome TaxID=412755 RepID=A0A0F9Z0Y5_9ZZZZ|nr:flagellar basal-body MS-ring/collar protein FliF [Pseudohongiella sp.]HDZ09949.1 flagellar basal body M-ring protein FliF [Pseudohongiella sp.]HEA63727.1 flagellar basal body M-ring protein FliF [Pseudohongiella sp.]